MDVRRRRVAAQSRDVDRVAERRAALGGGRQLERRFARQRRHLDIAAERRQRELDRDFAEQILTLTLEELVFLDREHDVEIARITPRYSRFAVARRAQT